MNKTSFLFVLIISILLFGLLLDKGCISMSKKALKEDSTRTIVERHNDNTMLVISNLNRINDSLKKEFLLLQSDRDARVRQLRAVRASRKPIIIKVEDTALISGLIEENDELWAIYYEDSVMISTQQKIIKNLDSANGILVDENIYLLNAFRKENDEKNAVKEDLVACENKLGKRNNQLKASVGLNIIQFLKDVFK